MAAICRGLDGPPQGFRVASALVALSRDVDEFFHERMSICLAVGKSRMPTAKIRFTSDYFVETLRRGSAEAAWQSRQRQRPSSTGSLPDSFWYFAGLGVIIMAFIGGNYVFGLIATAVGATIGALAFLGPRIKDWFFRRAFRNSSGRDEEVSMQFTEEGLRSRTSTVDTTLQWSAFTKVAHFSDGFLLFHEPKALTWIPMSSLSRPDEAGKLEALLRAKIQEHVVVEPHEIPKGTQPALPP